MDGAIHPPVFVAVVEEGELEGHDGGGVDHEHYDHGLPEGLELAVGEEHLDVEERVGLPTC